MPTQSDLLVNRRDLDFLLFEWLKITELFDRPVFSEHSRETVAAVLDMCAEIATHEFLPHYRRSDVEEPRLTETGVWVVPEIGTALRAYADAGLSAAVFDMSVGGLQLPEVVCSAAMSYFMAANVSTTGYAMLTVANARLLTTFGQPSQVDAFAKPQIEGRFLGTMCLSEPQAGSSLADITTRAIFEQDDDLGRRFRLFGNKMWISGGDHELSENIVHLVLAKIPGADGQLVPGTKGVSVFIVPKYLPSETGASPERAHPSTGSGRASRRAFSERNDVVVGGLNHKMGYRGIVNCLLNLGEGEPYRPFGQPGAVGYLVGEPGQGLSIMFHMMNEARIGVGLGAAMLGYRGYRRALEYARQRAQGRPLGRSRTRTAEPQVPIIEHPDVKRMLLAQKSYVEGALALVLYCAKLTDHRRCDDSDRARAEASALLDLLTPVAKTWPSEWGLAANDLAIQIYGGYGYARDYDVEQLYRDNRLNAIHEGTTGIQALDLLGRKVLRDRGAALNTLRQRVSATAVNAETDATLRPYAAALQEAWLEIASVAETLMAIDDESVALRNATPFLAAFGHAVVAWLWLEQAVEAASALRGGTVNERDTDFYNGKLRACRFFFEAELPKIRPQLAFVASGSDVASGMPQGAF
jgi:alkylation response protein AidB-like acyl-CoA dehydrogenase